MMELVYVHYNKDGKNNYFYFIPLFQRSHGELAGLRTRDGRGLCLLTDGEVSKIKESAALIDRMTPEEKYEWMMKNIASFNSAYRTILTKYIVEIFSYRINVNG
jgi:hypothetical protein